MLPRKLHSPSGACQSTLPIGTPARVECHHEDVAPLQLLCDARWKPPAFLEECRYWDLRCNSVNDDQPTASFPQLPYPSAARTPGPEPTPPEQAQPTAAFPRLPYPSAEEGAPAPPEPAPAGAEEPPKGWRARRRAAKAGKAEAPAAAVAAVAPGEAPAAPEPQEALGTRTDLGTDLAGPMDIPDSLASSARGLRRQRRRLLNTRDQLVFHLGGLAYELHLLGELNAPVAQRRAGMIYELDSTVSAIDAQLASRSSTKPSEQRLPIVVGSCRTCHTLFVAEARYCMKCGAHLAPAENREPTP